MAGELIPVGRSQYTGEQFLFVVSEGLPTTSFLEWDIAIQAAGREQAKAGGWYQPTEEDPEGKYWGLASPEFLTYRESVMTGVFGITPRQKTPWYKQTAGKVGLIGASIWGAVVGAGFAGLYGAAPAAEAAITPVSSVPVAGKGVSLAGGGWLLEGPTSFASIGTGAGTALVAEPVKWGTLAAIGAGLSSIGGDIFKESTDLATTTLKTGLGNEIDRFVNSVFGGTGVAGPSSSDPANVSGDVGFLGRLASMGSFLPVLLIGLTILGAFLLTRKSRRNK